MSKNFDECREDEDAALAQVLIELAFLLPKNTDARKHPLAKALGKWLIAIRRTEYARHHGSIG